MLNDNFSVVNKYNLYVLLGPVLTGIFIFVILYYLLVPLRINLPLTMVMSVLVLGLTKYYLPNEHYFNKVLPDKAAVIDNNKKQIMDEKTRFSLIFVTVYLIFLAITFFTSDTSDIFVPWSQFTSYDTVKLISSIALGFFIPGYAIVNLISSNNQLEKVLKLFLAYFISILLTGLCGYITASLGFAVSDNKHIVLGIYLAILTFYITLNRKTIFISVRLSNCYRTARQAIHYLRKHNAFVLVFLSLFLIEILSTYYLFNGTIIGDQWFHHGRSLMFITGALKAINITGWDFYPPLLSSLLSQFIVLAGIPSVNAYVSLNFLNMIPVLAFYFFITKWLPARMKKAALLAAALFMLSSGYGWSYVLQLSSDETISSQLQVLEIFRTASLKTMDLNALNNFINSPHPWNLSSLIIISLPAGFLLLSLLKIEVKGKLRYFSLIVLVSFVGLISHDEFYLFILVASVLPLIYQVNKSHIIFLSLISSILLVFLIDTVLPVKFFTTTTILGTPLFALCLSFVFIMWGLYNVKLHIRGNLTFPKINSPLFYDKRTQFVIATAIVSTILYLYFFSFIVWDYLSIEQVSLQTDNYGNRDIPWYLFPMKFGIVGLLGLLFLLSYMYKKFEREIFVFAILVIFAFLLGPYYDEHRFGKYIMVGMIAFASLMIYRIICYFQTLKKNVLIGGILLGIVITSSGLSFLMMSGFTDILLLNPHYRLIPGENNRFFPTQSEINLLTELKNNIVNIKTDNIALLDKDYGNGLLSEKIMGFVGIPFEKIYHNPLILNASSLTAFYQLLDKNDIRYILIQRADLNASGYTDSVKFALDNFPRVYQDNNYLVLKVPQLIGPTQNPDVAVIYDPGYEIASAPAYSDLQYDTGSYGLNENGHVKIEKNHSLFLSNNETNPTIAWSNLENKKTNFIETEFKIIQENKPKNKIEIKWENDSSLLQQLESTQFPNNNVGIRWTDSRSEYSLLLTNKGMHLSTTRANGKNVTSVINNEEILKETGKSYNIKILLLDKEIIILVNDLPRIQIPREDGDHANSIISKIEVISHGNNVEFLPIKVKQVSNLEKLYYRNLKNIDYVISSLAMSEASYGVFLSPDLSASKTTIIPFDPTVMSASDFNTYLEYVRMGGTVIVLNSGNIQDGVFAKFLSVNSTNEFSEFNKIASYSNHQNSINISGKTRIIRMPLENDLKEVSSYNDNLNNKISPFAIEKQFPNNGKIIYINNAGFFDAIPHHNINFLKLANFTNLLNLNHENTLLTGSDKFKSIHQFTQLEKFVGLMELNGQTNIKSSSLVLHNGQNKSDYLNLRVNKLVLSNGMKKIDFDNVTIRSLRFHGQYTAEINLSGLISAPSSNSFYDYLDFHMPVESSAKIKVATGLNGGAQVTLVNNSRVNTLNFTDFEMDIQKSDVASSNHSLNFLVKNPEIKFNGSADIDSPDFSDYPLSGSRFLKINGTIITKFDHVDDYHVRNNMSTETRYVTYLNDLNITGKTNPYIEKLRIMGDISYRARNHDVGLPLQQIFISTQNIILLVSVFVICFFISRLLWSRKLMNRL